MILHPGLPTIQHRRFNDPLHYAANVSNGDNLLSVLKPGTFTAELISIAIGRMILQRGREMLPRLASTGSRGRVGILGWFGGTRLPVVRGIQMREGDWLSLGEGMESHHRTFGPNDFVTLTLKASDLNRAATDVIGRELTLTAGAVIRPPAELSARLLSMIDAATRVARTQPEVFMAPLAAAALEQALLLPMMSCLSHGNTARRETISRRQRAAIAKRFEMAAEANVDRPMLLQEICQIIGVSARTLRKVCEEQLAVSPQRYLTLRRLHMTREALLRADRHCATVTEIATRYGFWELGRFSGIYKILFGEAPSETLRRPVPLSQ
jgi:AraC-like DNA-binding protein